jgi:hypothetical protein
MEVVIIARLGANQQSGLELDRGDRVHAGPNPHGAVLVFDDHTTGFRWVTPGEYRETADPLDRHDLVAIQHGPDGFAPVCSCGWRWGRGWPDPDEAARAHGAHQRHMATHRRRLTQPVPPPLLAWIQQLRADRRQEPER